MTLLTLTAALIIGAIIGAAWAYWIWVPGLRGRLADAEINRDWYKGDAMSERADADEAAAEVRLYAGEIATLRAQLATETAKRSAATAKGNRTRAEQAERIERRRKFLLKWFRPDSGEETVHFADRDGPWTIISFLNEVEASK